MDSGKYIVLKYWTCDMCPIIFPAYPEHQEDDSCPRRIAMDDCADIYGCANGRSMIPLCSVCGKTAGEHIHGQCLFGPTRYQLLYYRGSNATKRATLKRM